MSRNVKNCMLCCYYKAVMINRNKIVYICRKNDLYLNPSKLYIGLDCKNFKQEEE